MPHTIDMNNLKPMRENSMTNSLEFKERVGSEIYARQAFQILRFGFTVAPLPAGADKFFHFLTNWNQ